MNPTVPDSRMTVRVARKGHAATDICDFELQRLDGAPLPPFTAGSHIDVILNADVTRQYSLCNGPEERDHYHIAVLRDPKSRGGSVLMHQLNEGDVLEIQGPRNLFPLSDKSDHSILLAGGIGITPMLSMAAELLHREQSFELHYCARDPSRAAFLETLQGERFKESVSLYFDSNGPESRLDLKKALGKPEENKHLYVCGPAGFIDAVLGAAKELEWPEDAVHREYFGAQPLDTSASKAFYIKLAQSDLTLLVSKDESVLDVLRRHGIDHPTSCEQGVCGTCLTPVLEGIPDHKDAYLTDAEKESGNCFLPCCSRAKSELLVLDL